MDRRARTPTASTAPPVSRSAPTRLLILGSPASGKTRLSHSLAARTGWPIRHLDDEYWGEDWTRPDPQAWTRRQRDLAAANTWIIDGNYLDSIPIRAVRAHAVILVDTPTHRCLYRAAARAARIRCGRHEALPTRVRTQAAMGTRVRATQDFASLVRKIIRFRRRDWWSVVAGARTNPSSVLLIAVSRGFLPSHAAALRHRLRARDIPAAVLPLASIPPLFGGALEGTS